MKKITTIKSFPSLHAKKRVAAYARVLQESERLMHSLSAQVSYYSDLIQQNPEWQYAGVYADEGITGTSTKNRDEFNRLMDDCKAGKVDIILTKSISRFARNTVDLLETVRSLKAIGVEVRFEKEKINSLSADGEVMLTLLASFAQEEVTSISNNVKWSVKKRFEQGLPNGRFNIYGYRWEGDVLVPVPEEAETVRFIFDKRLEGATVVEIANEPTAKGVLTRKGEPFSPGTIGHMLHNITYTGNLLLQKEYRPSVAKSARKNNGELPQYWVENSHEAIIPLETYQKAQTPPRPKIQCAVCGGSFYRRTYESGNVVWICNGKNYKGACTSDTVPDAVMVEARKLVPGWETIRVQKGGILEVDVGGGVATVVWDYKNGQPTCHIEENPVPRKKAPAFYKRFYCAECGKAYGRQVAGENVLWRCYHRKGCSGKGQIPEDQLELVSAVALGLDEYDEELFRSQVQTVDVTTTGTSHHPEFHFTFHLHNKDVETKWSK